MWMGDKLCVYRPVQRPCHCSMANVKLSLLLQCVYSSYCTQVFSETTAAWIKYCAKDDSVNGGWGFSPSKNYRQPVSNNSGHRQVWRDAISVFETMCFQKRKPTDRAFPPVLAGWIKTLKGFLTIQDQFKKWATQYFLQELLIKIR